MANVPGVNGNTYDLDVKINGEAYVKIGDQLVTKDREQVHLFLRAYKMGRDHKKTEIRNALNI